MAGVNCGPNWEDISSRMREVPLSSGQVTFYVSSRTQLCFVEEPTFVDPERAVSLFRFS